MSKTIDEAAKYAVRKEFLCEKCAWKDNCDFCGGENAAFDCCECPADSYEDGFKACANYVYGLPLASRLTAKEKERMRKKYKGELEFAQFYQRKANSCCNQQCKMEYEVSRDIAKSRANMLESIFGADFFKEGE